jgi:transposase-like protein
MRMNAQWEALAKSLKFQDEKAMWQEYYEKRGLSITVLSNKLACSPHSVRSRILVSGLQLRKRGGPNAQKLEITQEVLDQVLKIGVPKTAKLLNVTAQTLYRRLYYQHGIRKRDLLKQVEEGTPLGQPVTTEETVPAATVPKVE